MRILVGSMAFFGNIDGFHPKDRDYAVLVENAVGYRFTRQRICGAYDIFEYAKLPADEMVAYAVKAGLAMRLNAFLVPEFAREIGLEVPQLEGLRPLAESLDDKHRYLKVIYNAYLENGKFELTDGQRMEAYKAYKEARKDTK